MERTKGCLQVELFGPFRAYGRTVTVPLSGEVSFTGLLDRLEDILGPEFRRRAAAEHTAYIINNEVVDREEPRSVLVRPGDLVTFTLPLDGG